MPKIYLFILLLLTACQIAETPKPRVYRIPTLEDYIRARHKYAPFHFYDCERDFSEDLLRKLWHIYDDAPDTTDFSIKSGYELSHIWGKYGHIRWVHTDFLLDLLETGIVPVNISYTTLPMYWEGGSYQSASFWYKDFIVYKLRNGQACWAGSLMGTPHAEALAAIVDAHRAQYATALDSTKYRWELARLLQKLQTNGSGYEAHRYLMQLSAYPKTWGYHCDGETMSFITYFNLTAVEGEELYRSEGYSLFSEPSFEHGVIQISEDNYLLKYNIIAAAGGREPTFIFFRDRVMQGSCQPVHYFLLYYFDENYQLEDWKLVVPKSFLRTSWTPYKEEVDFSAPYPK